MRQLPEIEAGKYFFEEIETSFSERIKPYQADPSLLFQDDALRQAAAALSPEISKVLMSEDSPLQVLLQALLTDPAVMATDVQLMEQVQRLVVQHPILAIQAMPYLLKHAGLRPAWAHVIERLKMPFVIEKYITCTMLTDTGAPQSTDLWSICAGDPSLIPLVVDLAITHYPHMLCYLVKRSDVIGVIWTLDKFQEAVLEYCTRNPQVIDRLNDIDQFNNIEVNMVQLALIKGRADLLQRISPAALAGNSHWGGVLSFLAYLIHDKALSTVVELLQKCPQLLHMSVLGTEGRNIFDLVPFVERTSCHLNSETVQLLQYIREIRGALLQAGLWRDTATVAT